MMFFLGGEHDGGEGPRFHVPVATYAPLQT